MNFSKPFTDKEKIQLLQRSILVNSYAYYELNENILTDFQYDANTRQLLELKKSNPEAWQESSYFNFFDNFESGTGFDLMYRVRDDPDLYHRVVIDALCALDLRDKLAK